MKILEIRDNIVRGYRIVSQDGDNLVTLAGGETVDPTIGKINTYAGNGLYLGTSRQFVRDYYSGLSDLPDALLTYTFNVDDVLSGDPQSPDSELTVSKATLIDITSEDAE